MNDEISYESLDYCLKTAAQQEGAKAGILIVLKEDEDGDISYWHNLFFEDQDMYDLLIGMVAGHMHTLLEKRGIEHSEEVDFEADLDEFLGEDWESE